MVSVRATRLRQFPVRRPSRRLLAVAAVLVTAVPVLAGLPADASRFPESGGTNAAAAPTDQAVFAPPSNLPSTLTRGRGRVTLSQSAGLTRQLMSVSWSGMHPSTSDGSGSGSNVMVMQCRGWNPSREDCWMGDTTLAGDALGGHSGFANSGFFAPADSSPWQQSTLFGTQLTVPFRRGDGKPLIHTSGKDWAVLGLGGNVDDFSPGTANYRRGFTGRGGAGEIRTWVNTAFENPSLGCSSATHCSLVVVPIRPHPCRSRLPATQADLCRGMAADPQQPSPAYWQLAANWNQRYVFQLSLAPAAFACAQRADTAAFIGSEAIGAAMRRWVAARCAPSSPVALDYTVDTEPDARRQVGTATAGGGTQYLADAAITGEAAATADTAGRRPQYAPVAVSGFAIGFVWDRLLADGSSTAEVRDLRLNARLVAKLLTQSYPGRYASNSAGVPVDPNTRGNPDSLVNDPEFGRLNPGAAQLLATNLVTQLGLHGANNDVFLALSRWLWSDADARNFLQGKPDPWKMRVNAAYRGWKLPTDAYGLRDGWTVPKKSDDALAGYQPGSITAQPVPSWSRSADILLTAQPASQHPEPDPTTHLVTLQRDPAQTIGTRSLLVVSTTSELALAGAHTASLRNAAGKFVQPNGIGLAYALRNAKPAPGTGILQIDQHKMDPRGYPGAIVSYAMVPTAGLPKIQAKRYADTIRWLAGPAQTYGAMPGQLPPGYLALPGALRTQALHVATAVERQSGQAVGPGNQPGQPTVHPTQPGNTNGPGSGSHNQPGQVKPTGTPPTPGTTSPNPTSPSKQPGKDHASGQAPVSSVTRGEQLGWLGWALPALLVLGLLAGVASPLIRLGAQPGNPVRNSLAIAGRRIRTAVLRSQRRR
jgi:hypothetical protein